MSVHVPLTRAERLTSLASQEFDLLVIGGGITGAGIARDASRRGLAVALVESGDFGSGTSSRSSRLIHGGVRYLEHGYLHLVFEASRERRRLLKLAPHIVRPLRFTWPVYKGARIGRWMLGAGLTLYDALALFRNVGRHSSYGSAGILNAEPSLSRDGLTGGATYWDAATDDSRLTLANVIDASAHNAVVVNYAEVRGVQFASAEGNINGALIYDKIGGKDIPIRARLVINAAGPWTDSILRMEDPSTGPAVRGTKGVHITVPADRVGNQGAVTMLSPDDGRVMFTLPSGKHTIIGTTDTPTNAHPDDVRANRADVRYLLSAVNRFFPDAKLTEDDVVAAWAGIRPLVASGNSGNPSSASREHEITFTPRGMLTITGGKLTTYRAMAQQCVDIAIKRLGLKVMPCDTHKAPLPGARPEPEPEFPGDEIQPGLPWRTSDVDHGVNYEFAEKIGDVLIRRTTLAFETRDHGLDAATRIAKQMGELLGWTEAGGQHAVEEYRAEITRMFEIDGS